jgi:hypothetical protein
LRFSSYDRWFSALDADERLFQKEGE